MRLKGAVFQIVIAVTVIPVSAGPGPDTAIGPSRYFDLSHWKLQLPGPADVDPGRLAGGYASRFFSADTAARAMRFWIDASLTGSTTNSDYVRSELRQRLDPATDTVNWTVAAGIHVLHARVRLPPSTLAPDKLTFLQIHGYGDQAPPLLRVARDAGHLILHYKTDATDTSDAKADCGPAPAGETDYGIRVQAHRLQVQIGDSLALDRDVAYWTWPSYFKAGLYPQSHAGEASAEFTFLEVIEGSSGLRRMRRPPTVRGLRGAAWRGRDAAGRIPPP